MHQRSRIARAALITALVLQAGCGDDAPSVAPVKREKPAAQSPEAKRALADPESPASVVANFWRLVGVGALPAALASYDEDVVRAVGTLEFAGMVASQQQNVAALRLNVLEVERIAGGALVVAEAIPAQGPKSRLSFFLDREDGSWLIRYDTYSAGTLGSFVQQAAQRKINPNAKVPSTRAVAAADTAVANFRAAALAREPRSGSDNRRGGAGATAPPP